MLQRISFSPFSSSSPPPAPPPPGSRGPGPLSLASKLFSLRKTTSSDTAEDSGDFDNSDLNHQFEEQEVDKDEVGEEKKEVKSRSLEGACWDGENLKCESGEEEQQEEQELLYEAESPDEAALVHAAHAYRVTLRGRSVEHLLVELPGVGPLAVPLLHVLPFHSSRRRMSVVVRHPLSGRVVIYTKGADSVILELCQPAAGQSSWLAPVS